MLACGAQGLRFDCQLCKIVDDDDDHNDMLTTMMMITDDYHHRHHHHHPGTATSCKSQLVFPLHLYICKMEIKLYLRSTFKNYVKFSKTFKTVKYLIYYCSIRKESAI